MISMNLFFRFLAGCLLGQALVHFLQAAEPDWPTLGEQARGQTVYWNAWAGDDRTNRYLEWAAAEVKRRYGVEVRHVKLSDTAEAVTRVLAEKAAGKSEQGSVDLIWINGENFAAMKREGLLFGPFLHRIPNYRWVETNSLPTLTDFTIPVEGLEAPWGIGRFVFLYDRARVSAPPRTPAALLKWAKANPGRFTYPQPPDFLGTTFLKQLLLDLTPNRRVLYAAATESEFVRITAPLWNYLDELHPALWRRARAFPMNGPAQIRLLGENEIDVAIAFGSEAASSAILTGQLPNTVRCFGFEGGTIGNASFLAIPFNSRSKAGAQVLINFLLSPEAQARKQDPRLLGGQTVLAIDRLDRSDRTMFEQLPSGVASLTAEELGTPLAEPHPYWMERLEKAWLQRYGVRK